MQQGILSRIIILFFLFLLSLPLVLLPLFLSIFLSVQVLTLASEFSSNYVQYLGLHCSHIQTDIIATHRLQLRYFSKYYSFANAGENINIFRVTRYYTYTWSGY
jgi:hypothetical protein